MITIPLLLLLFVPDHYSDAQLADFARLNKSVGTQIAIIDRDGVVREGLLAAATADALTMDFSGTTKTFSRDVIATAERLRDGRLDGTIKGALFGLLVGLYVAAEVPGDDTARSVATGMAIYGGIGWALDAAQNHRQPLYRAPAPSPALKVSLRF